jgi:hypothetical protein
VRRRRLSREWLRLIRKLRRIGLEEEAHRVELAIGRAANHRLGQQFANSTRCFRTDPPGRLTAGDAQARGQCDLNCMAEQPRRHLI